jgi:RimJ/RimL family protein N-acetyltransferase
MAVSAIQIKPFDRINASKAEYAALNAFNNRIRVEQWPEDAPIALEHAIRELHSVPSVMDMQIWAAWQVEGREIVGRANVSIFRTNENKHLLEFHIAVLPEMRRRGVAKSLLKLVVEQAHAEKRRLLQAHTDSAVPSGEAFMQRLGARMGLASHTNQLNLCDLDQNLIRDWQKRAPEADFELEAWESPCSEEEINSMAALHEVMNTEPRDDLELEDWHWTPEQLRQWEASMEQRKTEHWTMYVRERRMGDFAGYTEVFWNPSQPENLQQGDTGVFPKYRNRGLGRWLKAAMLEKVLRDRPQVKRIRTGNADSNAPMLKINYELGFKPYKSWSTWQVELDRVLEYLGLTER